jgi:FemAB-related protein (PEP-CTERM system-associated)
MIRPAFPNTPDLSIVVHPRAGLASRLPALTEFVCSSAPVVPLSKHPGWLNVLQAALGHEPFAIEAVVAGRTHGFLPLAHISSLLFGRFLVSLPYLNTNGVIAASADVQAQLVSRAVTLADEMNVRFLELRHERPVDHPDLGTAVSTKAHMRLDLPRTAAELWKGFDPRVRNLVRKGDRHHFSVTWGGAELLDGFYDVLTNNMRDLGTPVYGRSLFAAALAAFPDDAEVCLVRDGPRPVASALLLHGRGVTEVPTASALKEYNPTAANMLMYWHLLQRAVGRGQRVFDFGRATVGGNTYRFKKQWGATPHPAVWQYCLKDGDVTDMRPDNPRYQHAVRLWRRLPVGLTRYLGPVIVRGIP